MRNFRSTLVVALTAIASVVALSDDVPEETETAPAPACTATSATNVGAFYDLRQDIAVPPSEHKSYSLNPTKDYHSRGYDYGKNFTLNICGPVIEPVTGVVGVESSLWANISAYYTSHGDIFSIGTESMDVQTRGRKVILQYTGGSPCGDTKSTSTNAPREPEPLSSYVYDDADAARIPHNHEIETLTKEETDKTRRKSTLISFICDREHTQNGALFSFVGTDPDECSYFFEVRSVHACAQAEPHKPGSVGPGSVFGLILVIAVLVYILGGVFYNRTVAHARGWRQLPNYSMWAGIWNFICVREPPLKIGRP